MKKLILAALILFQISLVLAVQPFGAETTFINSTRAPIDEAQSIQAQAGNVTEINIFGYSPTQTWQGYFGNITGTIQLADAGDNVMYNWSLASPQGEIYASTNDSINWANIQCFNFTAEGNYNPETGNEGNTSMYGTNLTQLEELFNIDWDDVDGVNETFNLFDHDKFYTNNLEFSENECRSTRLFGDAGNGTDGEFEEVLMYEPTTRSVVFASIIDEDVMGFDNRSHDFQMLVLEDGHGTDTEESTYYFYVELE
ncbi:hypothetical protein KAS08_04270 [Candidatus Pacearchaeota archaeon]|nr:hypothetical protein [Candidatus Pacearchaeota archaeon]